jgi:hypothetical protein
MGTYIKHGPILTRAECVTCEEEFVYVWVRKRQRYCSRKCRPGEQLAYENRRIVKKSCEDCGASIFPRGSNARTTKLCKKCVGMRAGVSMRDRFIVECGRALCGICGERLPAIRHLHQRICVKCRESVTDTAIRKVLKRYTPGWTRIHAPEQLQLIRAHRMRKLVLRKIGEMRI